MASIVLVSSTVPFVGFLIVLFEPAPSLYKSTKATEPVSIGELTFRPPAHLESDYEPGEIVECYWTSEWTKGKVIKSEHGRYLIQLGERQLVPDSSVVGTDQDRRVWLSPKQLRLPKH